MYQLYIFNNHIYLFLGALFASGTLCIQVSVQTQPEKGNLAFFFFAHLYLLFATYFNDLISKFSQN